jgi:NADH dehydrogenase (ubiquinone) 1 beta subcomplex subunit 9
MSATHKQEVCRLYRQAIKLARDWCVYTDLWRSKAVAIRYQFDMNKHVTDPRKIERLIASLKLTLHEYRHPEPYIRK